MKLDLFGWFPEENESVLSELIREQNIKTVIEIGCFLGKSTQFFVKQGCTVTSIDTFAGAKDLNNCEEVKKRLPNLYEQFLFNLKELGIEDKVTVIKGSSEDVAFAEKKLFADLVYIDGSHEYGDVFQDILLWSGRALRVICGDDYSQDHPGVRQAVDQLLPYANKSNRCWFYLIK